MGLHARETRMTVLWFHDVPGNWRGFGPAPQFRGTRLWNSLSAGLVFHPGAISDEVVPCSNQ